MQTNTITSESFTRVNNDVNGNPRYVIHFLDLLNENEQIPKNSVDNEYRLAVGKANKIGGKKYNTKAYGGGIIFQSYNLPGLVKQCNELLTINN